MEPLPNANKAYSMVLRVEKQREVSQTYPGNQDNGSFLVKAQTGVSTRGRTRNNSQNRGRGYQGSNRGRGQNNDRTSKVCDYCNMPRHTRDTCFQLVGYPEWYQQYKAQKGNADVAKTEVNKLNPFDHTGDSVNKQDSLASMLQGLQLELDKIKGKIQVEGHIANFTKVDEYAGTIFNLRTIKTALHTSLVSLEQNLFFIPLTTCYRT